MQKNDAGSEIKLNFPSVRLGEKGSHSCASKPRSSCERPARQDWPSTHRAPCSSKLRPSFRNVGKVSATGVFRAFSVEIGTAILPERGEHTASPSLIGPQHSFLMDRALRSGVLMFRGAASEMPCQAGDGQVLSGVTMS